MRFAAILTKCQVRTRFSIGSRGHRGDLHYLGPMSVKCLHCGALHFDIEKLSISTRNKPKFGMCCLQGQVRLAKLKHPPTELWNLFSGSNPLSANFKKNIRQYNAAFAFTSLRAKIDYSVLTANGHSLYTFQINGELYHHSSLLIPDNENAPTYAQIYINDEAAQRDAWMNRNPNLSPELIAELQAIILCDHPYVDIYQQAL